MVKELAFFTMLINYQHLLDDRGDRLVLIVLIIVICRITVARG